ncbi:Uncharacterized protein Rs2_35676 [Raphanus sativus]|nr:Uncharacterized protein Rs2_35676 [Raphanus sativus]
MLAEYSMASSRDLKMKQPIVDDSARTFEDGFKEAKLDTTVHYRALLRIYKEFHDAVKAKHFEECEVERHEGKLEMLKQLEKGADPVKEKERVKMELQIARERSDEVKVPTGENLPFTAWVQLPPVKSTIELKYIEIA